MSTPQVTLRRAEAADARFMWEVNNHPTARAESISTNPIPWETHEAWFARKLADPSALVFIGLVDGKRAGVVRFDIHDGEGTISIAVSPAHRGHGVGSALIARATDALLSERPAVTPIAWVRRRNEASLRAFARAGYIAEGAALEDGVELQRLRFRRASGE